MIGEKRFELCRRSDCLRAMTAVAVAAAESRFLPDLAVDLLSPLAAGGE